MQKVLYLLKSQGFFSGPNRVVGGHIAHIIGVVEAFQRLNYEVIILSFDTVPSTYPFLRVVVNPNGVNPKVFSPDVSGAEVRKAYGLQRKKIGPFLMHLLKPSGH